MRPAAGRKRRSEVAGWMPARPRQDKHDPTAATTQSTEQKRVKEIEKMGYEKIYASKRQVERLKESIKDINIKLIGINTIDEAISYVVNG